MLVARKSKLTYRSVYNSDKIIMRISPFCILKNFGNCGIILYKGVLGLPRQYILNFYEWLDNTYIKNYNSEHPNEEIIGYSSAKICSNNNSFKTLLYQPQADLDIDVKSGISSRDKMLDKKMLEFINMSLEETEAYSLVLTPEYSVSLDVIEHLFNNCEKISVGTLYCLCCQSVNVQVMSDFIKKMNENVNENIIFCDYAWEKIERQVTVCCLMYVLKIKFDLKGFKFIEKTFFIPQFKINPMKDINMDFEKNGLSCGSVIFEFGMKKEVKFLSLICADVFKFELIDEIKERLDSNTTLIFNPQMNKKPQNDYFRFMRNMLMSYTKDDNIKIITLNWAQGTKFFVDDKYFGNAVSDSWSTLYEKFREDDFEEYTKTFDTNAKYGLNIAHDYHLIMYFLNSFEHIVDVIIENFISGMTPTDTQRTIPFRINNTYVYDTDKCVFVQKSDFCKEMIDDCLRDNKEFQGIINCKDCNGMCSASKLNEFVASLNDKNQVIDEYKIINDGKITSITSKHYKSEYSREKMYLCRRVLNEMKKGRVTKKFISKNARFVYNINKTPLLYNTTYFCEEKQELCRVFYLKYKTFNEVEKIYDKLSKEYEDKAESFIIYYEDVDGMKLFEKNVDTCIVPGGNTVSEIV